MNKEELLQAINKTNSRTFTVTFVKADGTIRTMYAKTGIKRALSKKPVKKTSKPKDPNLIRVYDKQVKGYRSFKLDSVLEFRCNTTIIKKD